MNNLWTSKYKPQILENIIGNKNIISKIDNYISDIKTNKIDKRVILITGYTGSGKTLIANLVLQKYNYRIIEYNSTNIEGTKTITNIMKNSFFHSNVLEMFMNDNKKSAIIIDDIDSLCKIGSKSGINDIINYIKLSEKKKGKKSDKINIPLILVTNNIYDKKLTNIRKYSHEFKLNKPTRCDIETILNNIIKYEKIDIDIDALIILIRESNNDIRRAINMLYDLTLLYTKITLESVEKQINIFSKKKEDLQLYDSIKILFNKKLSFEDNENIYELDSFLIPFMIHENYINIFLNRIIKDKKNINNNHYKSIFNQSINICNHDIISNNIIKYNNRILYNYLPYFMSIPLNLELTKYTKNNINKDIYKFTELFNKISIYHTKKNKFLNFIMNIEKNIILSKDINILSLICNIYIFKKKSYNNLKKIIEYYNFNYDDIETIIKMSKDSKYLTTSIKRDIKKIFD